MKCPNCGQAVEPGAPFCGNCGQPLTAPAPATPNPQPAQPGVVQSGPAQPQVMQQTMAQAAAVPAVPAVPDKKVENKAMASIVLGAIGIPGALIPILGLILGITGLVLGIKSRSAVKHKMSMVGIILSGIAILVSLAAWGVAVSKDPKLHGLTKSNETTALDTPCYSATVPNKLSVHNSGGSCDLDAYNGSSLDTSSEFYSISSTTATGETAAKLPVDAKTVVQTALKEISTPTRTYSVSSEHSGTFLNDPAYFADMKAGKTSAEMIFVLHTGSNGDNLFMFIHALDKSGADTSYLASHLSWK